MVLPPGALRTCRKSLHHLISDSHGPLSKPRTAVQRWRRRPLLPRSGPWPELLENRITAIRENAEVPRSGARSAATAAHQAESADRPPSQSDRLGDDHAIWAAE